MSKIFLENLGKLALCRMKESSLGAPQTNSCVSVAFDLGSGLGLDRSIEDNRDQIRGVELPTRIFAAGQTAGGKLNQKRAKPDFLAFAFAYLFGQVSTSQVASGIYQHTITPAESIYLPSFTMLQRRGDSILKERFAGNLIESVDLELGESWVGLNASVKGIGKREVNYFHEAVAAPENSTQITLAQNGVEGDSAAERVENVFRVRAKAYGSNLWTVCKVTAVSAATPAVITLESAVGQSGNSVSFQVDYIAVEPAWCDFPGFWEESPLRLVDAQVIVDGYFNGTSIAGGEVISRDLLGLSVSAKNELEIRKLADGSGELYASDAIRKGREVTIKLSERLRNTVLQWQWDHPETEQIGLYLKIRGAEIVPASGYHFGADIAFPLCGIVKMPLAVSGKVLAQEGDLLVMDDGICGGAFVRVWNQVSAYL
jgi:hypothetical protein